MWYYSQSTGQLHHDLDFIGVGYSGLKPDGYNNPEKESVPNVGPIPKGVYFIGGAWDHPRLGPCVMNLRMTKGDSFGRLGFFIHGNDKANNASHGCIILDPTIRHMLRDTTDRILTVKE